MNMKHSVNIVHPSIEPFIKDELDQYVGLIDGKKSILENDLSLFFSKYPKFLSIGGYFNIAREVVLFNPLTTEVKVEFRLDFLRQRIGDNYWDIVELKTPNTPIVKKSGKHSQFSSTIQGGIEQLRNYKLFLDNQISRLSLEQNTGLKTNNPNLCLIGGRQNSNISLEEIEELRLRYGDIKIFTYDDLLIYASENYKNKYTVLPYQLDVHYDLSVYAKDKARCLQNFIDLGSKIKVAPFTAIITYLSRLYPDDLLTFIESFSINELATKCYNAYSFMIIATICSKLKKTRLSKPEQVKWKKLFVESLNFEKLSQKLIFNNPVSVFRFLDELRGNEQYPVAREGAVNFLLSIRPDEYAFVVRQAPNEKYKNQKLLWIIRNLIGASHPWVKEVHALVRSDKQEHSKANSADTKNRAGD